MKPRVLLDDDSRIVLEITDGLWNEEDTGYDHSCTWFITTFRELTRVLSPSNLKTDEDLYELLRPIQDFVYRREYLKGFFENSYNDRHIFVRHYRDNAKYPLEYYQLANSIEGCLFQSFRDSEFVQVSTDEDLSYNRFEGWCNVDASIDRPAIPANLASKVFAWRAGERWCLPEEWGNAPFLNFIERVWTESLCGHSMNLRDAIALHNQKMLGHSDLCTLQLSLYIADAFEFYYEQRKGALAIELLREQKLMLVDVLQAILSTAVFSGQDWWEKMRRIQSELLEQLFRTASMAPNTVRRLKLGELLAN